MPRFAFKSTIADIDETVEGELCDPANVLILEIDDSFIRVVVPDSVLASRRELLGVWRTVHVVGEVRDSRYGPQHVATHLRLVGTVH